MDSSQIASIETEVVDVKNEISILRKQIIGLREKTKKDNQVLQKQLRHIQKTNLKKTDISEIKFNSWKPIGYLETVFKFKNGTPRQPTVCGHARGQLTVDTSIFNNPEHSLEGLESFNYLWIIFIFHKNNNEYTKSKVKPPRLDGAKVGLFSTRCPYRPNPIGLTLARIEKVEVLKSFLHTYGSHCVNPIFQLAKIGATIFLSGIDILDSTPVLDIKPYISNYDHPGMLPSEFEKLDEGRDARTEKNSQKIDYVDSSVMFMNELTPTEKSAADTDRNISTSQSCTATWINKPPIEQLDVRITNFAEEQLLEFDGGNEKPFHLEQFRNSTELRLAIINILKADPRSVYRRNRCQDRLYYFCIDNAHVTCWFNKNIAEVLQVQPMAFRDPSLKIKE